jgi:ubiquitin-conjugating enzyme E2 O
MDATEYEETYVEGIEEIEDDVDRRFKRFKSFRVLQYPPHDHQFRHKQRLCSWMLSATRFGEHANPKSSFSEKIKKDWETLAAVFSDHSSIFVTTYESRIDLMRVCIAGLEGTPYCYGLFFFDIFFPPEYPAKPPEIFYHAPDFDLSPCLHQDGRVSLNLLSLNQWYRFRLGGKQQSWNPERSDISRVLLSIQHLILNDKPYLNESISFVYSSKERSSKYNNEVFMSSCEAMLAMLRFSPGDCGDFVLGHFRKRAHRILLIYKDQMLKHKGDNGMKQLFFKLVKAFESNGAYCQHHCSKTEVEQLKRERLNTGGFSMEECSE